MSTVAILGSAYADHGLLGEPVDIPTPMGPVRMYRVHNHGYVLYRHGLPHRHLPHQIPYRQHALALRGVGCSALLVTTSAVVLDPELPLFELLAAGDVLMPDNRLPDGSTCTLFDTWKKDQGHLVLEEGLISNALTEQVASIAHDLGSDLRRDVVLAYVTGPRTMTAAESLGWRRLGAQATSMTTAPELVLANELGIPCAAIAFGQRYAFPGSPPIEEEQLRQSLERARGAMNSLVDRFLEHARPVEFGNALFQF